MIKNVVPLITYLVLAIILMAPLLPPGYYLALDMQFGPSSFADFQFANYYGMAPSPYGAYIPYRLAMAALSQILGAEGVEKLLLLAILFLCGAGIHFALPEDLGNSRYFGGLLYTLNPFVFVRFMAGHWALLLSYALWPLGLKYFSEFLERPGDRHRLAKAALITTLAAVSSHGVLILLLAYLVLFALRLLQGADRALLRNTVALGGLVLLMNLYWIVPTLALFGERFDPASSESNLAEFSARAQGMPIPLTLLSMHGFWRGGFKYTKNVFDLWYVPLIIMAALALAGLALLFKGKNSLWMFFILVIPVALLFALGDDGPLPLLFNLFEKQLPIYFFFRDSQKFVGLICLAYAWLGSVAVGALSGRLKGWKSPVLIGLLCSLPVIYNFGFFGFLGQIGPTQFPDDWKQAEAIIAADPAQSNILFLPLHFYIYYPWVNGTQKDLGAPARMFFSKPVIVAHNLETQNVYSDVKDPPADYVRALVQNRQYINNTAELLLPLNVRYVMILKDFPDTPRLLYLFYRKSGVPNISLVYESDTLYLFRNELATGPFITSQDAGRGNFSEIINMSASAGYSANVTYEKITPVSYRVLSSQYPDAAWTERQNGYIIYDGKPASSWHSLGSGFAYQNPAIIENSLFYAVLALFIIAWLAAILLVVPAGPAALPALIFASFAAFLLSVYGIISPVALGWLVLTSVTALIIILLRRPGGQAKLFKPKASRR
ncbi:MAG TPA: hypothetical protein VLD37_06615 [Candidatus Bilamarchaeum sp.]|nr:hypothetical protein [Candidatus Bilamarchaeum sp.]